MLEDDIVVIPNERSPVHLILDPMKGLWERGVRAIRTRGLSVTLVIRVAPSSQ